MTPAIVYIAGAGRSGSTLLDNLLGAADGWFSAGELRLLWAGRQMWTHRCGCGEPLRSCPVWTSVLDRAGLDVAEMAALQERLARGRSAGLVATAGGRDARARYVAGLQVLHQAIADTTGAAVVVDSSKSPAGAVLTIDTGAPVTVVHLVRDPRAVAWSWRRTAAREDGDGDGAPFGPRSAMVSTTEWLITNAAIEVDRRRRPGAAWIRIRYEDLVTDPASALTAIRRAGPGAETVIPLPDSLPTNHTAAGNPSRFRTGPLSLRNDDEWRQRLARRDRRLVTGLAAPFLWRYGYGS